MAQYGSRLQRNSAVVAATAAAGVSLLVLGSYTYSFLQRWKKWQAVLSPVSFTAFPVAVRRLISFHLQAIAEFVSTVVNHIGQTSQ